ncbi:8-amino-7-oxononanoate synthase [Denitrovibrio acetiphilus DSM 12809]|uniref:8-amino-7-ketopelargonate synthase n=1 Tax=Denitrovibrio acetiphilus (strain DSM 12809 / NBRC 114555 / N2460) TaxID=522772 RepID=D4H785_DENA2|nr:8-amino-7-oxononanoate synthase [Denitrovibrio acetiphilus]ADD67884.1 8-amino-7-oxononanoate synthase [Denitrovibrio acetiphilus DSM 12809]
MRDKILRELEKIKAEDLYREMPAMTEGAGRYVEIGGLQYLNLSSNNYLGLSGVESVREEAEKALRQYGTTSGASRIVTGNYKLYDDLERKTASYKNCERALVFNSGYAANLAVYTSLCGRETHVFSDKLNHASIIDGIRLSGAKHIRYKHNDMADLEALLEKYKDVKEKVIATDTVFSMDGDVCQLYRIVSLAEKYGAMIIIDEAHATGVFGRGRGYAHEIGLADRVDVHMGTFSKALGSFGGYVASSEVIIDYLRNKARSFIYSTSLPPAVVGASVGALKYLAKKPEIGGRLLDAAEDLRFYLSQIGFETGMSMSQIIPVVLGGNKRALLAKEFLLSKGLYVAAIRPPTVPVNTARLRLSLRLDVLDEMDRIKSAFKEMKEAGI